MASRRAPSPLPRSGSFGGAASASPLAQPSSSSGGAGGQPSRQRSGGEDALDVEMRRVTPSLPASSGGLGGTISRSGSGRGAADVFVVDPSSSRPATGASGIGPSGPSTFLTADPPVAALGYRPGSGASSTAPSYGRRASGAGGVAAPRNGATSGAATPLDMSMSMDAESALVLPHHQQGI